MGKGKLGGRGNLGADGAPGWAQLKGKMAVSQRETLQAGETTTEMVEAEVSQVTQASQFKITKATQCLSDTLRCLRLSQQSA